MDYSKLEDFSEYEREIPCVSCGKPAKPTVSGNNFKCWDCGHLFKEDGSKTTVECTCLKCNPGHDPLEGKTKGKRAELQLPKQSRSTQRKRRPNKPSKEGV